MDLPTSLDNTRYSVNLLWDKLKAAVQQVASAKLRTAERRYKCYISEDTTRPSAVAKEAPSFGVRNSDTSDARQHGLRRKTTAIIGRKWQIR